MKREYYERIEADAKAMLMDMTREDQ